MELFGQTLPVGSAIFFLLALALALGFEFVNGFHDTANAVATVIYTNTLRPTVAVVWSGCWNLIGVLASSGAVAFGVIALLPVDLMLKVGTGSGFAMVFALLISAIIWNLGTWYLGLPASSSHTLVGAIMGVGLVNSWSLGNHNLSDGINWTKASEIGLSLLISPVIGFASAALLLLLSKALIKRADLYSAPDKNKTPPLWIRLLLMLTCTGVSFAHGSNDGQKGMGLIMLILVGILPFSFAVDLDTPRSDLEQLAFAAQRISVQIDPLAPAGTQFSPDELSHFLQSKGHASPSTFAALAARCREIDATLQSAKSSLNGLTIKQRQDLRGGLYLSSETLTKLRKQKQLPVQDAGDIQLFQSKADRVTKFIPSWVKLAVALALGFGTMVGWKRIVVTVGEKIGKEHLTYAQGAAAEIVAMGTILAADHLGLPVSTTHVLSSGIAGTMAANRTGLQMDTLRNLMLAWLLTLPVCVLLGAGIFAFALNMLLRLGAR